MNLDEMTMDEAFDKVTSKYDKLNTLGDRFTITKEKWYVLCKGLYLSGFTECPIEKNCNVCVADDWHDCYLVDGWYKQCVYNKPDGE